MAVAARSTLWFVVGSNAISGSTARRSPRLPSAAAIKRAVPGSALTRYSISVGTTRGLRILDRARRALSLSRTPGVLM